MNVASLDLCRQLFKLSGWEPKGHDYYCEYNGQTVNVATKVGEYICPAYNLGFLVRELLTAVGELSDGFSLEPYGVGWIVRYNNDPDIKNDIVGIASTPENAACSLAIELFKSGVLK